MRLTTERLVLRPLRDGDQADVLDYRGRSDVNRYLENELLTADTVSGFVLPRIGAVHFTRQRDRILLAVTLRDRVIGDMRLRRSSPPEEGEAEIGWVMHPVYHGRGYATEAAAALIDYGFTVHALSRVWAGLDPRNVASARVCLRLGMHREAASPSEDVYVVHANDRATRSLR